MAFLLPFPLHLNVRSIHTMPYIIAMLLALCMSLFSPPKSSGELGALAEIVAKVNEEDLEASIKEGTYRGEAGVMRLRPEVAERLGLKVFLSPTYREANELYRQIGWLRKRIRQLLSKEPGQDVHSKLADFSARYNQLRSRVKKKYLLYRLELENAQDQRMEGDRCMKLMKGLLSKSLSLYSQRLRDSLAHFYNTCHGLRPGGFPLSVKNVIFVNKVVSALQLTASPDELSAYDLDRQRPKEEWEGRESWKRVLERKARAYGEQLGEILSSIHSELDPLFVMAVMKRESNFDPRAVSAVGAVGLMQIMPQTAKGLGLRFIYEPDYLDKAANLMARERKLRAQAWAAVEEIRSKEQVDIARRAHSLMQRALDIAEKRMRLFERYRKDVRAEGLDERLHARKAILAGIKYLRSLFRQFNGDLSLVLAAYNAGPSRVKKYSGIPPFEETVTFRNVVLGYYNEYLGMLGRGN